MIDQNIQCTITYRYAHCACHPFNQMLSSGMNQHRTSLSSVDRSLTLIAAVLTRWLLSRSCLDQLLIAIRSLTLLCDHSRSKTRLIAIVNLIAKLEIIDITACHAILCATTLDCLRVSCHCRHAALTTIYKHRTGRGRWRLAGQLQQQMTHWVCLECCAGCQPATHF